VTARLTPEQAVIRRTARRITLQTAVLFAVCVIVLAGLAALFILRAQDADAQRQLTAAVADDDAVSDPPSGVVIYQSEGGRVRSSPQLHGHVLDPAAFASVLAGGPTVTGTATVSGREYRLRTARRGSTTVQAGLDLTVQNRERHRLTVALLAAGAIGLLISVAAGSWIARRAVRPLEMASLRQRRFVADASHELRTPLTQAHTRAQMLHRALVAADDRPDLVEEAARMVRSTRQLGDIVEELLLAAQLTADPATVTSVDLAVIAADAVDAEQARAREREITIGMTRDDGPHTVSGTPTALRRVVNSLIDNALGHVDYGGSIAVAVERRGGAHPVVVCTVTDDGHGFPAGDADTMFERFARGNHGDPRRFGLGLALARDVIHAHNGTITAASVPHGGAVFTVVVPANAEVTRGPELGIGLAGPRDRLR
jgi:two-component system, OmpR family, sensor kinase